MADSVRRPRVLFVCGSLNQTTQMHQIARHLGDCDQAFTPYYCDGALEALRRRGALEFTVLGERLRARCLDYLHAQGLRVDLGGVDGPYDLALTCCDLIVPRNLRRGPLVLVQEGILDPPGLALRLCRRARFLPRWLAGTASTGLSLAYDKFCVASDGYRDHFIGQGVPAERLEVTGIPNFDDCRRYLDNDFPHRGHVLACTSDARETFKRDDRGSFIAGAARLARARGKTLIFKLHPNENAARATAEVRRHAPDALVYASGCAEQMIANCDVLLTQYSSTVFVGLALGKEVHSYFDLEHLRRLLPIQSGAAARRIAEVCRGLLERQPARVRARTRHAPEPPLRAALDVEAS